MIGFEVSNEKAFNAIMDRFDIDWADDETMLCEDKDWGKIQEVAYEAGGEVFEVQAF